MKMCLKYCMVFVSLFSAGCFIYVPTGEYEGGSTIGKSTIRTSVAAEEGRVYVFEKDFKDVEHTAVVFSSAITYGLFDNLDISYTTWYNSSPFLSSKFSLKYQLYASTKINVSILPASVYATSLTIGSGGPNEEIFKSQRYYAFAISIPISYKNSATEIYCSPRLWFGRYSQRYRYNKYSSDGQRRWEYGEDTTKKLKSEQTGAAIGIILRSKFLTLVPELLIVNYNGKPNITGGIRFSL